MIPGFDEAAFPVAESRTANDVIAIYAERGLTKREYIAVQLMAGTFAGQEPQNRAVDWAVTGADALLAKLNEKPTLPPADPLIEEPE